MASNFKIDMKFGKCLIYKLPFLWWGNGEHQHESDRFWRDFQSLGQQFIMLFLQHKNAGIGWCSIKQMAMFCLACNGKGGGGLLVIEASVLRCLVMEVTMFQYFLYQNAIHPMKWIVVVNECYPDLKFWMELQGWLASIYGRNGVPSILHKVQNIYGLDL